MPYRRLICLAIFALSFSSLTLEAQTVVSPPKEPLLSGEIGLTVANQYMTRGFVVQNEGISFQPHFDLNVSLYEGDGFINSATALIGLWSVLSSTPYTDTEHSGGQFTELDYGVGLSIGFAERWTFTAFYNRWTSPTGAYEDGDWILAALEFDDHGLFPGTFSLEPFLQVLHEFNSDLAPGLCFEPGIRPNVTFFPESSAPVNVGVLMMAGLGSGFYGVDYGYFAVGPQVSVPLGFIDPAVEKWTVYAECLYYDYGITTTAENGRENSWMLSVKIAVNF